MDKYPTYVFGTLRIDTRRMVAIGPNGVIKLTTAEWLLLALLARNAPEIVSFEMICRKALLREWNGKMDDRAPSVLIAYIRKALPKDDTGLSMIRSLRGSGFFMRAPDAVESSEA